MRKISKYELEVIEILAKYSLLTEESDVEDIHPEDRNYHHIELIFPSAPWKGGGYQVLADYVAADADGSMLSLLILGDKLGRPYELEIQRFDGHPILKLPNAAEWLPVETKSE